MTNLNPHTLTYQPPPPHDNESRLSVPAIVTYWLLFIWSGIVLGVFLLVAHGITIDGILLALVSGLIGTQTTLLVAAVSFWVGATVGGKQANERLSQASAISSAALERIATGTGTGSGAEGSATVTVTPPAEVTVTTTERPAGA